jgi:hypothetical protein
VNIMGALLKHVIATLNGSNSLAHETAEFLKRKFNDRLNLDLDDMLVVLTDCETFSQSLFMHRCIR